MIIVPIIAIGAALYLSGCLDKQSISSPEDAGAKNSDGGSEAADTQEASDTANFEDLPFSQDQRFQVDIPVADSYSNCDDPNSTYYANELQAQVTNISWNYECEDAIPMYEQIISDYPCYDDIIKNVQYSLAGIISDYYDTFCNVEMGEDGWGQLPAVFYNLAESYFSLNDCENALKNIQRMDECPTNIDYTTKVQPIIDACGP